MQELTVQSLKDIIKKTDNFYICENCDKIMYEPSNNIYMEDICPACGEIVAEIQIQN